VTWADFTGFLSAIGLALLGVVCAMLMAFGLACLYAFALAFALSPIVGALWLLMKLWGAL
jgi:energy-converting hydrogenase Eha subunit H